MGERAPKPRHQSQKRDMLITVPFEKLWMAFVGCRSIDMDISISFPCERPNTLQSLTPVPTPRGREFVITEPGEDQNNERGSLRQHRCTK